MAFSGIPGVAHPGLFVPGRWSASSTPVVITDPAFIRGLEATFTFNDLVLNDLSQPDRYRLSKIDGLYDAEVRDSREANPSRHGESAYSSFYSGRTLAFNGTIYAGNLAKMRNMTSALQQEFADMTEKTMIISFTNETATYIRCAKNASLDLAEIQDNDKVSRNFLLTLRAPDPRFYSEASETITITPTKTALEGRTYNLTFDRDYDGYPTLDQFTFNNRGNASFYPDIKFSGALEDFVLINYTTGERLIVNTNIPSGEYYYYDQTKSTFVDSGGVSRINALDIASSNMSLAPGNNIIGFGGKTYDSNAKVEIYAKSSWL